MADREQVRKDHPDSWVPVHPGDSIDGHVTAVVDAWSDVRKNGSYYPLLTIKGTASGYGDCELQVHAFGTVLYNEIMRHQPEVGEHVIITYRGEGEAKRKGMNPPQLYRVACPDRKDQGSRAYGRIKDATVGDPATPTAEPVQTSLADEDVPF